MQGLEDYVIPGSVTLIEAIERIQGNHSRCVAVVEGARILGLISEGDVMRALLRGTDVHCLASEVMNPSFTFLNERDLGRAAELMRRHLFTMLPIVDEEFRLRDVITLRDVLEFLATPARQSEGA